MDGKTSSPEPIQTAGPSSSSMFSCLGGCSAVAIVAMFVLTRGLLQAPPPRSPLILWFLGVMWPAALALIGVMAYRLWAEWRRGPSTLLLDAAPVRVGGWITGQVSAPPQIHGGEIRLHVECIKTWEGNEAQSLLWRATLVLDGTRLDREDDRVLIPFAVQIVDTAPPTTPGEKNWVDWLVRVEAKVPGDEYAAKFPLQVLPADPSVPVTAATPRAMPEITPEQLARRLAMETVGHTTFIRLPLPMVVTTLLILFLLIAVAVAAPGLPWSAALDEAEGGRLGAAALSGGLALLMLLSLMSTTRRIEIRPESVRLVRGLFGLGFHSTIPARDVVAVEGTHTRDLRTVAAYGVRLHLKQGPPRETAIRLPDPVKARALVHVLEALLIQRA
jgi:hypothetical protein